MCLRARINPGRCRCEASPFSPLSTGDSSPSPSRRQWFCGLNRLETPPPDPNQLVNPLGLKVPKGSRGRSLERTPAPPPLVKMEDLLPFVAKMERDGTKVVILVGVTGQYNAMLMNFVCNLRRLGLAKYLAVAAMDPLSYKFALAHGLAVYFEGFRGVKGAGDRDESGSQGEGCEYGTMCFKQLTKVKSRAVVRVLKAGYAVLWTDVDIVWFSNPLPEVLKYPSGQLPIQANEPLPHRKSRINSGFYLARPDKQTIKVFEEIIEHAAKSNKSEQPSFQQILCGAQGPYKVKGKPECKHPIGLRTMFLDRRRYANGAIFDFWNTKNVTKACARSNVVILHNNWISGKGSKEKRFVLRGYWFYDMQRQVCSREPIYSKYRTIAPHVGKAEDAVLDSLAPSAIPKIH